MLFWQLVSKLYIVSRNRTLSESISVAWCISLSYPLDTGNSRNIITH